MTQPSEVPALIAYLSPFRIVETPEVKWECALDQVNRNTYDRGKLARLVGSIDVGLREPLCMHIGVDGALVLPLVDELLPIERAADFLNRFLAQICLGGIYSDSIAPEDIESCRILDGHTAWYFNPGKSFRSLLHGGLKYGTAGEIMSIVLLEPRKIDFGDIVEAHFKGASILARVPSLTPEFLIRGFSGIRARTWNYALAELWICVEQMTTLLWKQSLDDTVDFGGRQRKDMLANHQSWTTSVRQEVLFQRGKLDETTYQHLLTARKARNDLSHEGKSVTKEAALDALTSTIRLLGILDGGDPKAYLDLLPSIQSSPHVDRRPSDDVFREAEKWCPVGALANATLHSRFGK